MVLRDFVERLADTESNLNRIIVVPEKEVELVIMDDGELQIADCSLLDTEIDQFSIIHFDEIIIWISEDLPFQIVWK